MSDSGGGGIRRRRGGDIMSQKRRPSRNEKEVMAGGNTPLLTGQSSSYGADPAAASTGSPGRDAPKSSTWATRIASKPANMLIFFTMANVLLYLDRGAIASAGVNGSLDTRTCVPVAHCELRNNTCALLPDSPADVKCSMQGSPRHGFQGDFNLDGAQDGWLQSMFLVGLLVASPCFAFAAKSKDNIRLCGLGLVLWSTAVVCCGFTFDFWSLAICRTFVGIGEAALITIVPNFIDTCAPSGQKTKWLAVFCVAIPSGTALGYAYGGLVAWLLHWRFAFFIEGVMMLPLMCFAFLVPISTLDYWPKHKGGAQSPQQSLEPQGFSKYVSGAATALRDMRLILSNRVYVLGAVGYCVYSAMMGVYAYWGPKAGQAMYPDVAKYGSADTVFGLVTVVAGIIGTMLGGFLLDRAGVSVAASLLLCAVMTLCGCVIMIFTLFLCHTVEMFILAFTVGLILIFSIQGPINIVAMWTTPYILRPFACALYTVSIHVFGDVPSAPIAGMVHDKFYAKYNQTKDKALSDDLAWRRTLELATYVGVLSVVFWAVGFVSQYFWPKKVVGEDEGKGAEYQTLGGEDGSNGRV